MRRRRRLLDQLGVVSRKLERLLAGHEVTLKDIPLPQDADPRETPLERLRRFKKLLNEALDELARGEPRRCDLCAAPIPDAEVDEAPWATRCVACASSPGRAGGCVRPAIE